MNINFGEGKLGKEVWWGNYLYLKSQKDCTELSFDKQLVELFYRFHFVVLFPNMGFGFSGFKP